MASKSTVNVDVQHIDTMKDACLPNRIRELFVAYLELKYKGQGTELIPGKSVTAQGRFEQAASVETSYFDPYASGLVFELLFKK